MIHSETFETQPLSFDEVIEVLDMVNKEAFKNIELFKIGWDDLVKSKNFLMYLNFQSSGKLLKITKSRFLGF